MGDESGFEDITRAIVRRWLIVTIAIVVLAVVGAAYGRQTTSRDELVAEARIEIVRSNAVLTVGQSQPDEPSAPVEAARLEALAPALTGGREDSVSVRADVAGAAVVVRANGSSAAEAEELAVSTAQQYVTERRAEEAQRFGTEVSFQERQLEAITARIDDVNAALADLDDAESFALEGERIQLFDRLLQINERLDASRTNVQSYNASLSDAVLTDNATPTSSSGWIVFGLVGAVLGAMVGVGLALMGNALDHRIRSRADIERILPGARVLGVFGNARKERDDVEDLCARTRAVVAADTVVVIPAPGAALPAGLSQQLAEACQITSIERIPEARSARVIVAARAGSTTDADLAGIVADLDVRGIDVAGVLLWGVPTRDDEWARRPLLTTRPDGVGS